MKQTYTAPHLFLHLFCLLLVLTAFASCDPPSEPPSQHMLNVTALTGVLPAHTRGAFAVDLKTLLSGDSASQVLDLLHGNGTDPALNEPFSAITAHSLGLSLQGVMDTALLAQTTNPEDGLILLARLNCECNGLAEVMDVSGLDLEPGYKGFTIYSEPSSGLNATVLTGSLLVVAQSAAVQSVIDVSLGDAENAETGAAVGPYLEDLASRPPVTLVYGLPGMYKTIDTGITLNDAQALSLELTFSNGRLSGEASFYSAKASDFAAIYRWVAFTYHKPAVSAVAAEGDKEARLVIPIPESDIHKSGELLMASRHKLKMLFYIMEARGEAAGIASAATQPWKNFFVDDYPPSIFINYEIPESQVESFSAAVLPAGFEMKKLRILESDTPAYFLALNIYTALGLAPGVRFEWSVFVKDPTEDKPRFMVIQPLAAGISLDPVNLWTTPEPVSHVHEDGQLISEARQDQGNGMENYFTSTITWPQDFPQTDRTTREFVAANDYIFWGGGVCDHGLYSGSVQNRDVTVIPPGDYEITDNTPWAAFVNPVPRSVYVYQNALDLLVAPWWNLDAPYLDVTPEHLDTLVSMKASIYTNIINLDIVNAFNAREDAITPFDADNTTPAVFFNYVIPDAQAPALEAALNLPDGYSLEKTKILESASEEAYYLTLNVFNTNDALEGTRAEWSVYVDDGNGREHFMIIDLMTEDAALDPVSLLNIPSVVEHHLSGSQLTTRLLSSTVHFTAALDMADGVEAWHTLDWVEAKDFVCYTNGICDKVYFGEGSLATPLLSVDPALVTVNASTPWSAFIGSEPESVLLRANKEMFAKKAWYNVQPLAAEE